MKANITIPKKERKDLSFEGLAIFKGRASHVFFGDYSIDCSTTKIWENLTTAEKKAIKSIVYKIIAEAKESITTQGDI